MESPIRRKVIELSTDFKVWQNIPASYIIINYIYLYNYAVGVTVTDRTEGR